ncbi:MAG: hypothetical protein IT287_01735, partial [Bdellovibrionaceae bacterium]|nr:hypothetical protein [Pseudobdellovibrionaceae bacterium]
MKKIFPSLLFILGVSIIYYAFSKKNEASSFHNLTTPTLKSSQAGHQALPSKDSENHDEHHSHNEPTYKPTATLIETTPATRSITTVTQMSSLLKNYAISNLNMNDVIDDLEKRNMDPLLLKDSNPYTGTMYVLRTDSPLPGTRYFHAQYFTD